VGSALSTRMLLKGVGQTLMHYVEKRQIRFRRRQKTFAIKLLLTSSSLSVSPSTSPHKAAVLTRDGFLLEFVDRLRFWLKSYRNNGHFTRRSRFMKMSHGDLFL
jgi:hypothetical protein